MGDFRTADGIRLHYEEYGAGSRVVLSAMAGQFYPFGLQQALAGRGYHVYCMTLRGFFPSDFVSEKSGDGWYDRFAEDVTELADFLRLERFSISAHLTEPALAGICFGVIVIGLKHLSQWFPGRTVSEQVRCLTGRCSCRD